MTAPQSFVSQRLRAVGTALLLWSALFASSQAATATGAAGMEPAAKLMSWLN